MPLHSFLQALQILHELEIAAANGDAKAGVFTPWFSHWLCQSAQVEALVS